MAGAGASAIGLGEGGSGAGTGGGADVGLPGTGGGADGVTDGGGGAGGGASPRFSASARRAAAATPVPPAGAAVGARSVPVQAPTEPAAQPQVPQSAHRLRVDARAVRPEHSAHRVNGPHRDDRAGRAQPRDRHGGPAPAASRQARRRASPSPGSWRRETSTPQVVRPDQPGPATGEEAAPPSW